MEITKFSPETVTKYWKNQTPPTDIISPYIDPFFPPNDNSLLS